MADQKPQEQVPYTLSIVVDFDGTLTKSDTMHLVAEAGYTRQRSNGVEPRPWREIVDAYMSDFDDHAGKYHPNPAERLTLREEAAWLESLKPIEEASFQRAISSGVFDGINPEDVEKAAQNAVSDRLVELRPGWQELFTTINKHNFRQPVQVRPMREVQVISVNWSALFVRQVLCETFKKYLDAETYRAGYWDDRITICANELPSVVQHGIYSGKAMKNMPRPPPLHQKVQTSADKLRLFEDMRARRMDQHYTSAPSSVLPTRSVFMYVGDSSTDLECLLAADIGICIRDEPMRSGQQELTHTCERLSIKVLHIYDQAVMDSRERPQNAPCLLWARDHLEIRHWLSQAEPHVPDLELCGREQTTTPRADHLLGGHT